MIIKNADVFCEDGVFRTKDICTDGERIAVLQRMMRFLDAESCYADSRADRYHFHGCVGHDFCGRNRGSYKRNCFL